LAERNDLPCGNVFNSQADIWSNWTFEGNIRCMVHSALVFRNLKVDTEKLPFTEIQTKQ